MSRSSRALGCVVSALALAGTLLAGVSPARAANAALPLKVNFQAESTTTPSGYVGDYGLAYSDARGYGWTNTSGSPLSLVGNGRERGVQADKRLDTFVHMQLPTGSPGVTQTGWWRASVPNGTYRVTVGAGDPSYADSHHVLQIEGVTILDFTSSAGNYNQTASGTVTVSDGFLDVRPTGGTNTKIDFIDITPQGSTPIVTSTTPADGATNVVRDTAITVQLSEGLDPSTATSAGLRLIGPGNTVISGFYNTDGAYSNATFVPSTTLASNTTYTIQVTASITTPTGTPYQPYTSTFTTGTSVSTPAAAVQFTKSAFDQSDATAAPTALALGPDGRLYAAFVSGKILAYDLDSAGKKVGSPVEIDAFEGRTVIGMEFGPHSTSSNLELWVTNNQGGCDLAAIGVACNDFTGRISRLTGNGPSNLTAQDMVVGLPRSVGDHQTNGLRFGPDGLLYVGQAANNGYGAPDAIWGNRAEDALTAAVLQIDTAAITSPPLNVQTTAPVNYNPNAANAPLKLYVTGIRNPYSLLWHSNGSLYSPVNESANGNTPADPVGSAPALTDLPAYDDYFTKVVKGAYYGHPNPARSEYVLNGGNPTSGTDPFEVKEYPVGTQPNSKWRQPDMDLGVHRSADSAAEFKSDVFGGTLKGDVLVTEFSGGKDLLAIHLDSSGKAVSKTVVAAGFNNPLPMTTDPVSGRIYVGEFGTVPTGDGGKITLLSPVATTTPPTPTLPAVHVNFQPETAAVPTGYQVDYGQGFSTSRGYGWESLSTGAALSKTGETRERDKLADQRLDTFIHVARPTTTEAKWEYVVANGTYNLTVGVGDTDYYDSHHIVRAEGQVVLDFTPSASTPTKVVTAAVTVADGRLTLDQVGGTNTKFSFVDLVPVTTTPTDPPPTDPTPPTAPSASISSPDDELGLGTRLVFSAANGTQAFASGRNLTISNSGTAVLNVTGVSFGGQNPSVFSLCSGQSASFSVPVGGSATLCVRYVPGSNATGSTVLAKATITVATSDPSHSSLVVSLGGLNAVGFEDVREPKLQEMVSTLGFSNVIPSDGKPLGLTVSPYAGAIGNEVLSAYWTKLDTSKAVRLIPLARYSGRDNASATTATSGNYVLYPKGGSKSGGFNFPQTSANGGYGENQKLRPSPNGTASSVTSFNPSGSFGYKDGPGNDSLDTVNPGQFHQVRFFPALDAAGNAISGAYIVAVDTANVTYPYKNWDFQDSVFLLTNAKPDGGADNPVASEMSYALEFAGGDGGVQDSGFTGALGASDASAVSLASGRLNIAAAGSAVSPVNALYRQVNAGTRFRVYGRLSAPASWLPIGSDGFAGVFYGASATNQVRAVLRRTSDTVWNVALERVNGTTVTTLASTSVTSTSPSSFDLRIVLNPQNNTQSTDNPLATLYYSTNNGGLVQVGPAVSVPVSLFVQAGRAGVTQTPGSGAVFTARYERFTTSRDY